MPWIIPKIDWIATDEDFSYGDLNRIEQNITEVKNMLNILGYFPTIIIGSAWSAINSIPYDEDLIRIEQNIENLANDSYIPPSNWTNPKVDWQAIVDNFSYVDANRMELNLLSLYNMINDINTTVLRCGDNQTSICGKGNTLF